MTLSLFSSSLKPLLPHHRIFLARGWTRLVPHHCAYSTTTPFPSESQPNPSSSSSSSNNDTCQLDHLSDTDTGISILTLNRPSAKNAISTSLLASFSHHLSTLRHPPDATPEHASTPMTRVLILRSAVSGVFCSGADLIERATMSPVQVKVFLDTLRQTYRMLETLPVVTIAALDGAALGGGLEMALACDLRVAGKDARVGLPECRLGIIPGAGGTQRLSRVVGVSKAKEMVFCGKVMSGKEAWEAGVVGRFVEEEGGGFRGALELAREILPQGPIALRMAKLAIDRGYAMDMDNALEFEQACYAQVLHTEDRLEGLRAFKEKRKPIYKGR